MEINKGRENKEIRTISVLFVFSSFPLQFWRKIRITSSSCCFTILSKAVSEFYLYEKKKKRKRKVNPRRSPKNKQTKKKKNRKEKGEKEKE